MEGRNHNGSHSHSSGVVKSRSSSGCLIIKKKPDGVSRLGSLKDSNSNESKKDKKRPRLNVSDSLSSDEELVELHQVSGASSLYENNGLEDRNFPRNGLLRNVGPKRSKIENHDFDEYNDLSDDELLAMRHHHENGIGSGCNQGDIIYKRRNSFHGGSSSEKIRSCDPYSGKRRFDMSNNFPISAEDSIRLQGKNGVLKVRVKHKDDFHELASKNIRTCPSPCVENNLSKTPITVHGSAKRGRKCGSMQSPEKAHRMIRSKEGKVKHGSGTEKQLLREKIRSMLVDAGWTIDYRPRRGRDYYDAVYVNPTGTAYWSITKAYQALEKQVEEDGNSVECSSFAPITEDVLSILTRQTRKKMEKKEEAEGKRKNFDEDESDTDSVGSNRLSGGCTLEPMGHMP